MVIKVKDRKPPVKTDKKYPRLATVVYKGMEYKDFSIFDARFAIELAEGGSRIIFDDGDQTL